VLLLLNANANEESVAGRVTCWYTQQPSRIQD